LPAIEITAARSSSLNARFAVDCAPLEWIWLLLQLVELLLLLGSELV
jgi:hypothetical protein